MSERHSTVDYMRSKSIAPDGTEIDPGVRLAFACKEASRALVAFGDALRALPDIEPGS